MHYIYVAYVATKQVFFSRFFFLVNFLGRFALVRRFALHSKDFMLSTRKNLSSGIVFMRQIKHYFEMAL